MDERRGTLRERFDRQYEAEPNTGCWLWTGAFLASGYGVLKAHRASVLLHHGPFDDALWVLHKCDTPACVNPDHLFLGTALDNARDRVRKGRGRARQWITPSMLDDMRVRMLRGDRIEAIGRAHGVTGSAVRYHLGNRRSA